MLAGSVPVGRAGRRDGSGPLRLQPERPPPSPAKPSGGPHSAAKPGCGPHSAAKPGCGPHSAAKPGSGPNAAKPGSCQPRPPRPSLAALAASCLTSHSGRPSACWRTCTCPAHVRGYASTPKRIESNPLACAAGRPPRRWEARVTLSAARVYTCRRVAGFDCLFVCFGRFACWFACVAYGTLCTATSACRRRRLVPLQPAPKYDHA